MKNRHKQVVALGASAIAVVVILGYLIWSGYREAIHAAETTTRGYAATLEARLDASLRRADAELQKLASTIQPTVLNQDAVSANKHVDALLKLSLLHFPELSAISIFDANGDSLYTSHNNSARPNISDRSHFRTLRDDPRRDSVFSEVIIARNTGRPGITFTKALRDDQGLFRGVAVALIELDYFQKLFQSLNVNAKVNLAIYRSDDFSQVLRWPENKDRVNRPLPTDSPVRAALSNATRTATIELTAAADGIVRIYSYHVLHPYPFYIAVGVARDDALAGWRQRSLTTGLSTLLLLGLLLGLLLRLWRADAERNTLGAIVENSNDAIFSRALDGTILSWNAGAESMLGYSAAEAIGRPGDFAIPPGRASNQKNNSEKLLRGEIIIHETDRVTKDGRLINVLTSHSPIKEDNGNIVGVSVILQDITTLKQAQAAMQESESRFRDIAEAAGGYLWEVDSQFRFTFVSEHSEKLFGYLPAEMLGRTPAEFMPPGEAIRINAWIDKHKLADGTVRFFEHRSLNKSGQIFWQQLHRVPLHDAAGTRIGYRGTGVDITERKQAEESRLSLEAQLRESQKMEAIGTLAGGIAHDFNNIIATILGNAELARMDSKDNPRVLESLDDIRKASTRARDLVQQILSFSRRQPTERKPIDLGPMVAETTRLLRATLPLRLTLEVYCAPDTPAVLADATQIEQVLLNLATNAMQAMQASASGAGRMAIRLDSVMLDAALVKAHPRLSELFARHPGRTVRLALSDNGPGMDAATLERIFEPFFTTKPVNKGTGLGLSVVHGIMQTHEGAIVVESQPGKGAVFTLYLPVSTAQAGTPESAPHPAAHPPITDNADNGPRVLHIDDDAMPLSLFKRFFERRGYRVAAYTDSRAALDALRADPAAFDLVLTDYNMPGLSGLEVVREVQMIRSDLPVVVLSGFIDEALHAQAGAAGVRALISKADPVETIYEAVQRLVQTSSVKSVAS